MDISQVVIVGRTVKAPEISDLPSGTRMAKLTIAVSTGWGDKKKTSFFDCKCFGKTVDVFDKYVGKGKEIGITGTLEQETWKNKDGENRSRIVIVINSLSLGGKKEEDNDDDGSGDVPF